MKIKKYEFTEEGREKLGKEKYGKDWPVVYLINNDEKIYIGETGNVYNRFAQHRQNPERMDLRYFNCIFDEEFNKSAALDIEQTLIQLVHSDGKFYVQNLNAGQSEKHNYYQREKYVAKLDMIWQKLRNMKLAEHDYLWIKNNDLYKYSPYTSLTEEQRDVSLRIIQDFLDALETGEDRTSIVHGSAGTGKTITAINMIYNLANAAKFELDPDSELPVTEEQRCLMRLQDYIEMHGPLKIAFVLPMTSIRNTITEVFKSTKGGLSADIVKAPHQIAEEHYDIVFVDETHRLCRRKNIVNYNNFDNACAALHMDKHTATQLDWIVHQSSYRVLFYDEDQTVKGSDITSEQFWGGLRSSSVTEYYLTSQMRCQGGSSYISYVNSIMDCTADVKETINNYEFVFFDDVAEMIRLIKRNDEEYRLCRVVAGYSWKWISKGKTCRESIKKLGLEDIEISGHKYIWNMSNDRWISRQGAIDEIGCIHTTQGYDLNYVGIIFGREIDYDPIRHCITINKKLFFDKNVKNSTDDETLKKYIINAYKVMMTRGIKGCYVYAYNHNLKEYLKDYISVYNSD